MRLYPGPNANGMKKSISFEREIARTHKKMLLMCEMRLCKTNAQKSGFLATKRKKRLPPIAIAGYPIDLVMSVK